MELGSSLAARSSSLVDREVSEDHQHSLYRRHQKTPTHSNRADFTENSPISIRNSDESSGQNHFHSASVEQQRENLNPKNQNGRINKIVSSLDSSATFVRPSASTSSHQSRYQHRLPRAVISERDSDLRAKQLAGRDASSNQESSRNQNQINMELNHQPHYHAHNQEQPHQSGVSSLESNNTRGDHHARSRVNQHLHAHHQQFNQRQQHAQAAALCQVSGVKSLVNGANNIQPALSSPLRVKQHQPHCIHHQHHKSHCPQKSNPQATTTAVKTLASADGTTLESLNNQGIGPSADIRTKPAPTTTGLKYLKHATKAPDKSYLLVQYRPHARTENSDHHQQQQLNIDGGGGVVKSNGRLVSLESALDHRPPNNNNNGFTIPNKRTTIKFISQLYFLLHLSAILSLLLHHKNLVATERKLSAHYNQQQVNMPTTIDESSLLSMGANMRRRQAPTESGIDMHQPLPSTVSSVFTNQLPESMMLLHHHKANNDNNNNNRNLLNSGVQLISSVVVAQQPNDSVNLNNNNNNNLRSNLSRHSRQVTGHNQRLTIIQPIANTDILVRIVGHWHAKCALQYFLCYLLSSSITILICLRLSRMCSWHKCKFLGFTLCNAQRKNNAFASTSQVRGERSLLQNSKQLDSTKCGFYYRTRLDCTPVLIGSISLGLIQLIVIGLDIAGNVDWLGDNRWPIYLPFLQFAFVSLLMQFILSRVAKNHEQQKRDSSSNGGSDGGSKEKKFQQVSLSISNEQRMRSNNNQCSSWPLSSGLQNIALAHLLVTHILLWLMKLNSISLFQAIEQQQLLHQHHHRQQQHNHHQHQQHQQAPTNRFYSTLSPSLVHNTNPLETQSIAFSINSLPTAGNNTTSASNNHHLHHQQTSNSFAATTTNEAELEHNRLELENILRRKLTPTTSTTTTTTTAPTPRALDILHNLDSLSSSTRRPQSNNELTFAPINSSSSEHKLISSGTGLGHSNTSSEATVKNERGLRSATVTHQPRGSNLKTSISEELASKILGLEGGPNSNSSAHSAIAHLMMSSNSTPITISQAQLLNLLSLAAKSERALVENAQQNSLAAQQQQLLLLRTTATPTEPSKSLLPKRMTAFRQTAKPTMVIGSTQQPVLNNVTTTNLNYQNQNPKQRARVLVTHTTWDGANHVLEPESESAEERKRRGGGPVKSNSPIIPQIGSSSTTTERPFPSVDSDPPTPSSGIMTRELETSGNNYRASSNNQMATSTTTSPTTTTTTQRPSLGGESSNKWNTQKKSGSDQVISAKGKQTVIKPPLVDTTTAKSTTTTESLDDEAGTDDTGTDETDLDSLLPPVPNYNETSEEETNGKREPSNKQVTHLLTEEQPSSSQNKNNNNIRLQEEPFAFNEAASMVNITITPISVERIFPEQSTIQPQVASDISNVTRENSPPPKAEPLSMEPAAAGVNYRKKRDEENNSSSQHHRQQQPSFADYLLPIVYQYHILIIAILFNMWLDSLQKSPTSNMKSSSTALARSKLRELPLADATGKRNPSSGSELGSMISGSSSTRGLIAEFPMKSNSNHNLKHHHKQTYEERKSHWRLVTAAADQRRKPHHQHHHRSKSMDMLHHQGNTLSENESSSSSLSRYNSLRSSSSERLLWVSSSHALRAHERADCSQNSTLRSSSSPLQAQRATRRHRTDYNRALVVHRHQAANKRHLDSLEPLNQPAKDELQAPSHSVCSIFFGLLIVSGSLIVILLGVDLLSILTQCFTQLVSILVCLLGLLFIWRAEAKQKRKQLATDRMNRINRQLTTRKHHHHQQTTSNLVTNQGYHRQCFHYLFLLAAYYCGISIALNLSKQHSIQQLFSQQVIQFIQRHLNNPDFSLLGAGNQNHWPTSNGPMSLGGYLYLFHSILAIKGLLLIVQVTLQTVLIRSSCQQATSELRQIYTFLMFANLSLWAMEICEQQQHLQHLDNSLIGNEQLQTSSNQFDASTVEAEQEQRFKLVTLDGFSRFAASIVTLSHLYHGLVFMQH